MLLYYNGAVGSMLEDSEVKQRLRQWSEATALSLALLEALIKHEYPVLSDGDLRRKLTERLQTFRQLRA